MDKYLLWHKMTPGQQMNEWCDAEAKRSMARNINCMFWCEVRQLLPGENIVVFIRDKKLASGLSKAVRF